jgi:REP element-mobilizing transposase RayT
MVVAPSCDDRAVGYRSTNKTVYSAKYHIIWCPKYRRRVLVGPVEARLKEIIFEVIDEAGGEVIEVEVMDDHVHLLVEVLPAPSVTPSADSALVTSGPGGQFPERYACLLVTIPAG